MHKIIYMDKETQKDIASNISGLDYRLRNILSYINYYFSDENICRDYYLNKLIEEENDDGYV